MGLMFITETILVNFTKSDVTNLECFHHKYGFYFAHELFCSKQNSAPERLVSM